jgi:hypothetical protein
MEIDAELDVDLDVAGYHSVRERWQRSSRHAIVRRALEVSVEATFARDLRDLDDISVVAVEPV